MITPQRLSEIDAATFVQLTARIDRVLVRDWIKGESVEIELPVRLKKTLEKRVLDHYTHAGWKVEVTAQHEKNPPYRFRRTLKLWE